MAEKAVPRALLRECLARRASVSSEMAEAVLNASGVPLVVSASAMDAFVAGAPAEMRALAEGCRRDLFGGVPAWLKVVGAGFAVGLMFGAFGRGRR